MADLAHRAPTRARCTRGSSRQSRRRTAPTSAAAGVPERDNEAELDFWADYLDWSSGGPPLPALVDALDWCRAHQPATESEPVLLWGDVRLGNVIFGDDLAPLAVLDWDMASIGAPEHDVAWFTTLESTTRSLLGRHLDGFPDRDGTIAQYESLSGRTLRDFEWYEILAMVRSTAIMTRIGYLHRDAGLPARCRSTTTRSSICSRRASRQPTADLDCTTPSLSRFARASVRFVRTFVHFDP